MAVLQLLELVVKVELKLLLSFISLLCAGLDFILFIGFVELSGRPEWACGLSLINCCGRRCLKETLPAPLA